MLTDKDREDILADFAMTADLKFDVLRAYIQRYPELALELTDLFHEFTMVDLTNAAESSLGQDELETEGLQEGIAVVGEALSGPKLRELASRLELPRDFITGFRDAKVRLGSVPSNVLLNLARAIDVKVHYLIGYLQLKSGAAGAVAFKADAKPQGSSSILEYDEFVESLGLDDHEAAALDRLAS